jgi:cellulose synthase/poly-beta-1,6-N-acetylglucosamine synthase-like glycosyltransferase
MIIISFLITLVYVLLIILFIIGFDRINIFKNEKTTPKNTFSIIIPFRNEAENLPTILGSLQQLNYPINLFEILLVNDASKDNSFEIIESFKTKYPLINLKLITQSKYTGSPKKNAITKAVNKAEFDWIITTDCDCIVPKNWLLSYNQFIENKHPYFIAAPVKFTKEHSFLFHFQNLNFLSLIGSTIGAFGLKKPFLCNGANVCYRKDIFKSLNGFEGNIDIASGDDVFLLEKMVKYFPNKTLFLKSVAALVKTKSETNWNSFIHQQIRWASKSVTYKNWFPKVVGILVLLQNMLIVILSLSLFITLENWKLLIPILLQKMLFDGILIEKTAAFTQTKLSMKYFVITSLIYPFFFITIGVLSLVTSYKWKGRKFTK